MSGRVQRAAAELRAAAEAETVEDFFAAVPVAAIFEIAAALRSVTEAHHPFTDYHGETLCYQDLSSWPCPELARWDGLCDALGGSDLR
jgi:hypothetical protein